jgi:predicted TIM-barrel fold metal-dependent hydrolase
MDKIWANSGDSHYLEPDDLYSSELPPDLVEFLPRTVKDEKAGIETIYVDGASFTREIPTSVRKRTADGLSIGELNSRPPGSRDPVARLKDLDNEGIWGEVVYPSVGLWHGLIKNPVALKKAVEVTNDYAVSAIQGASPRLVVTAQLSLLDLDDAVAEVHRVAGLGFRAVSVAAGPPAGMPPWNKEFWEPLWQAIDETGMVIAVHIGTDRENVITYTGPGGAVLNYVDCAYSGMRVASELTAAGVLDRHPTMKLLVSEGGASWVPYLGDRMDEAFRQHSAFVRPKLSATPKEILYRQVYASFQHDPTAVAACTAMGYPNVVWGSDYPHIEGTFGHTQETLHELFDGVTEAQRKRITQDAFLDLFPHVGPPPLTAATDDRESAAAV